MERVTYRIVVGYDQFHDLEALRGIFEAHNTRLRAAPDAPGHCIEIASGAQTAQKVYDAALNLGADAVILSPDIQGYHHGLLRDLLLYEQQPIPVIGLVRPQTDDGRIMQANGALAALLTPLTAENSGRVIAMLEAAIEQALRDRATGATRVGRGMVPAAARGRSWQKKLITVYVPKGGGSTRTTLAVNLAVGLAHVSLGNIPTLLLDLDMAKGDCHTLLGFTPDANLLMQDASWKPLEAGLYRLIIHAVQNWGQTGAGALHPSILERFYHHWRGAESQLELLPGLTSPTEARAPEFRNWEILYSLARALCESARQSFPFVVVDIGQDYNLPLHKAALDAADDVLVTVPPTRTALLDTERALPSLLTDYGHLKKFHLVVTAYDPAFGISVQEIQRRLQLPLLTIIPFDAMAAHRAVNTATPFVIGDEGPLGESVRDLVHAYTGYRDDQVVSKKRGKKGNPFQTLQHLLVRPT